MTTLRSAGIAAPATSRRAAALWVAVCISAMLSACDALQDQRPPITVVVHVSVRPSMMDSSRGVLQVRNVTPGELTDVKLQFFNHDMGQEKLVYVNLAPSETKEFGWREGWDFMPSEMIWLGHKGYLPQAFDTFRTDQGYVGIRANDLHQRYAALRHATEADERTQRICRVVLWFILLPALALWFVIVIIYKIVEMKLRPQRSSVGTPPPPIEGQRP